MLCIMIMKCTEALDIGHTWAVDEAEGERQFLYAFLFMCVRSCSRASVQQHKFRAWRSSMN